MQTLAGSWGITVADHGGLLVAVRDYHQSPSDSLKYSCDEGSSWTDFRYTATNMTVYGVLTEPGEETSIIRWFTIDTRLMLGIILHVSPSSLYGIRSRSLIWDLVTINFSSIFPTLCNASDFYYWHPWNDRTESECILGLTVTIERRLPLSCCFIDTNYHRSINISVCQCTTDDYEWYTCNHN